MRPATDNGEASSFDAFDNPVKVVICGIGPAGLLLANYLLTLGRGRIKVVMYDKGKDHREVIQEKKTNRRYSIGLTKRAERCFNVIPGLTDKVKEATQKTDALSILFGAAKRPTVWAAGSKSNDIGWVVDRVSLCCKMLDALLAAHGPDGTSGRPEMLQLRFNCACTAVDLQKRVATLVPQSNGESAIQESYDLLVGADGLRSAVRGAFEQHIHNFEIEKKHTFGCWTTTHFACPEDFSPGTFHMVPTLPNAGGMSALGLPSPDGSLCFILGWSFADDPSAWLACSTPKEAHDFLHTRLPYFNIPEQAAWDLRSSPRQETMQVKCWRYHDTEGHAALIGDAAHATSPAIGQGCNASLIDANILGRLLLGEVVGEATRIPDAERWVTDTASAFSLPSPDQIRERLPWALERYSALQVKEGHALVDLSEGNSPISNFYKVWGAVKLLFRILVSPFLRPLISPPVVALTSSTFMPYSTVYERFRGEVTAVLESNREYRRRWHVKQAETVLAKQLKASE